MKRLLCWKNRVTNFQFVEFKKFNMKCEIERMEIIYTFYCAGGRIPGAVKMAGVWLIPREAQKPLDKRYKGNKK